MMKNMGSVDRILRLIVGIALVLFALFGPAEITWKWIAWIGVVPIVNLEWIQKIHRDTHKRGYSQEAVVETIINRMDDYVHDIVPQFSHTHINFQRIPLVDTSNPFVVRDVPTEDESMLVIRFRDQSEVDFPYLLQVISGSSLSRHDTLVIPGTKMPLAMDLIVRPMVQRLMARKPFA